MERSRRSLPPVLIPALLVVALAGYLIGTHRSSAPSAPRRSAGSTEETRIATGTSVLLEYPGSWQTSSAVPAIPGLTVNHPLLLSPSGDADRAGLLSGQLPAGEPSPLPASFLALLHTVPRGEVVSLEKAQAFRFSGLTGYQRTLDIYVIPTVGGTPTTMVCYAANGYSSYLQQCEQIVAKVTLVSQTSYGLTPDAAYASQLGGIVSALNRERVTLRGQMHSQPAAVSSLAAALAARFAAAAAAVEALEPPLAAGAAQAALASALARAHSAYAVLSNDGAGATGAETQVNEAEAAVDSALENFTLLGYSNS